MQETGKESKVQRAIRLAESCNGMTVHTRVVQDKRFRKPKYKETYDFDN